MKDADGPPETITDILDRVDEAGAGEERVRISDIVERIGDDAFAPLLLAPALVLISPASAIFGMSTFCGILIALIAGQMVLGRHRLWLPGVMLNRTISADTLDKMTRWMAGPARFVDRTTRKRLGLLVAPPLDRLWATLCLALSLVAPVFEFVPMSATIMGVAVALFGLAMIARDGLLALLGIAAVAGASRLLWSVAT